MTFERLLSSPYSSRMLESFGLKGSIRVSPIHCHNLKDIEKFANLSLEDALEVIKPVVKEASFKEAISAEEGVETEK